MIKRIRNCGVFILVLIALILSLKWMNHHVPYVKAQHQVITEKSIDVRALFYTESEVGREAAIDIRR
ncbi:MAG TPA: hypothetical protein PLY70_07090 [Saprospiraceae bacterium]|nr:hypothetical protein [Saprospiraceae bacterium]HPN70438.1 hypothetical protein [Saprospiraceae bacterium]